MPVLEDVLTAQRRRMERDLDGPLMRYLVRQYSAVVQALMAEALRAAEDIYAAGEPALLRRRRALELARQVQAEIDRITTGATGVVRERQRVAIIAGIRDANATTRVLLNVGVRLNTPAVERVTAALFAESPVAELFNALPAEAATGARNALIRGVIVGKNPRVIAADLRKVMGGSLQHSMTIARTETLRAYRGAAQETQRENRDVLDGWVWIAALSARTCAMCYGMHGTKHRLSEEFASHPSCRCSPSPLPRDLPPEITPGEDAFAELPAETQRRVLGPGKFAAYQAGEVNLNELVGTRRDPRWGLVRYERPLSAVVRRGAA